MYRIAIAEDDAGCAEELVRFVEEYGRETGQSFTTTVYPDGEKLVADYDAQYDILLLDVEMPVMDGMTAAGAIRQMDPSVAILFITNMPQYAIQGYSVDALDYILKPLNQFSFSQRLSRALLRVKQRTTKYITLTGKGHTRKLEAAAVSHVESVGHSIVYHTRDGDCSVPGTLQQTEQELEPLGFVRCNKGCLVNLDQVDGVKDGCVLIQNQQIPISRGRKVEFMKALTDYLGGFRKL